MWSSLDIEFCMVINLAIENKMLQFWLQLKQIFKKIFFALWTASESFTFLLRAQTHLIYGTCNKNSVNRSQTRPNVVQDRVHQQTARVYSRMDDDAITRISISDMPWHTIQSRRYQRAWRRRDGKVQCVAHFRGTTAKYCKPRCRSSPNCSVIAIGNVK